VAPGRRPAPPPFFFFGVFGRRFCLPQVSQHLMELPERLERLLNVKAAIDRECSDVTKGRKTRQDFQNVLEVYTSFLRGAARCSFAGRPPEVPDGLLPPLAAVRVMGQRFNLLLDAVAMEGFARRKDPC